MRLYEYLQTTHRWENTVWDKDYDVETYFYKNDEEDAWDKAMNDLAKLLTVVEVRKDGLIVNLSEVIENKLPDLKKADLFNVCVVDFIMDDIGNILAGNVSEEWLAKFVETLSK